MAPRFDLIGLVTTDLSRSLTFYRELGLDVPGGAEDAPHVETTLPGGLRLAWDTVATIQSFDPGYEPGDGAHRVALAFKCDDAADVDATYARMTGAGHEGHKAPWDAVWGMRYAILHDPDGNSVELFAELADGA
jgi:catechol 2,3-dioxygenase-like lactoylglutathione lyase family enzyme